MKNYVQEGKILNLIAPGGGVVSGAPVLIGSILAVPVVSAAVGETFAGAVEGVFKLAKATGGGTAITAGAKVWWDDTGKVVTKTASSHKFAGLCTVAAADGDDTVQISLDGDCAIYGDEAAAAAAVAAAVTTTAGGAGNASKLLKLDADGKIDGRTIAELQAANTAIAAAVTASDGGAGNAGKLVKLDGNGKIDGRDVGADGQALDDAAVTLDAAAPTIDGSLVGPVGTGLVLGRNVFGCLTVTAKVANAAIGKASVETAPASGVYKDVMVAKVDAGADVANSVPFAFWVPPGCRYKFDKIVGGAADVAFGGDGYNYADF